MMWGGEWTKPSFEETVSHLARSGATDVALFAAGYFADGNETLYREAALRQAVGSSCKVRYIPCLNASPAFAGYLCGRIAGALQQLLHRPFP